MKDSIGIADKISSYCFVFVCHRGNLEFESILLAESLSRRLNCNYEMFAAIPKIKELGDPRKKTIDALENLGVKFFHFDNPFMAKAERKKSFSVLYSNKIYGFNPPSKADKICFLDGDNILIAPFSGAEYFRVPFIGRDVWFPGTTLPNGHWARLFELCEAPLPLMRLCKQSGDGKSTNFCPPYFNGGFMAISREYHQRFLQAYRECFSRIYASNIMKEAIFAEQVAITVALHKANVPYGITSLMSEGFPFLHYNNFKALASRTKHAKHVSFIEQVISENETLESLREEMPKFHFTQI